MQSPAHRPQRVNLLWLTVMVIGLSVILAGCGGPSATPVAQAEVPPTATAFHTATPVLPIPTHTTVPPTDTPAPPTATSTPKPADTATPASTDAAVSPTEKPAPAGPSFTADIQPIFTERCIKCHSGDSPPRGLRLDSYEHALLGGTYRPVIMPGNPAESELVKRIKGEAIPRMPFDGPPFLDDDQIALIMAWIETGAPNN